MPDAQDRDAYDQALWFFEVWSHYGGPLRHVYYRLQIDQQPMSYTPLAKAATAARAIGLVDFGLQADESAGRGEIS